MEGKGPRSPLSIGIMGVLILALFVAQTRVEARVCCSNTTAINCFFICRLKRTAVPICAERCDCKTISGNICPPTYYPRGTNFLGNSDDGEEANINEYCKLGCAASVCDTMSTTHTSDVGKEEAVEQCNNACSIFCTKGVKVAMVTA